MLCPESNKNYTYRNIHTYKEIYFTRFDNLSTSSGDSNFNKYKKRFTDYIFFTLLYSHSTTGGLAVTE